MNVALFHTFMTFILFTTFCGWLELIKGKYLIWHPTCAVSEKPL